MGIQYFGGYQISCDSGLGLKYALIVAAVVSEAEIIQQQSIASLMHLST